MSIDTCAPDRACTATTRPFLSRPEQPDVVCFRTVTGDGRHVGDHQGIEHVATSGFDRLLTWGDDGGASGVTYAPDKPSTNCSCSNPSARVNHRPQDHRWATCVGCGVIHDTTSEGASLCGGCGIWLRRAAEYALVATNGARYIRPREDPVFGTGTHLYRWAPGSRDGFGGRRYIVRWDDGQSAGPADALWSGGRIPWWMLDRFPANGTIEPAARRG